MVWCASSSRPHARDLVVVGAGEEVGLVPPRVVVDAVDALLVALQGEVRSVRAQPPHLGIHWLLGGWFGGWVGA